MSGWSHATRPPPMETWGRAIGHQGRAKRNRLDPQPTKEANECRDATR